MKKLLLSLLAMMLLLPCLAQAETAREHVLDLASQAEATLEVMGLEPVETSLNPLTEWPLIIPADVMENELLPVLEGRHRQVVEDHFWLDLLDPGKYVLATSGGPSPSAARLITEAFALAGWTPGELAGIYTGRLFVSLADPVPEDVHEAVEESYLLRDAYAYYDLLIEAYADDSAAQLKTLKWIMMRESGWSTTVSSGNTVLRTSERLTDEMERDILIRFLRTACTPDPETGLRMLGVAGQYYSVLLNEETGRVERIVAEYEGDPKYVDRFVHLTSLLMDEETVNIDTGIFAQNGGYERLCGNVRISLEPVQEGQERRKLSAVWLDAQDVVEVWME